MKTGSSRMTTGDAASRRFSRLPTNPNCISVFYSVEIDEDEQHDLYKEKLMPLLGLSQSWRAAAYGMALSSRFGAVK